MKLITKLNIVAIVAALVGLGALIFWASHLGPPRSIARYVVNEESGQCEVEVDEWIGQTNKRWVEQCTPEDMKRP